MATLPNPARASSQRSSPAPRRCFPLARSGPDYARPGVEAPAACKEAQDWKTAQPRETEPARSLVDGVQRCATRSLLGPGRGQQPDDQGGGSARSRGARADAASAGGLFSDRAPRHDAARRAAAAAPPSAAAPTSAAAAWAERCATAYNVPLDVNLGARPLGPRARGRSRPAKRRCAGKRGRPGSGQAVGAGTARRRLFPAARAGRPDSSA